MNTVQITTALKILKKIQLCIKDEVTYIPGVGDLYNKDENYESPFNLSKSFGICWHVYSKTSGDLGIDYNFLKPAFKELGYKSVDYPVESTFMPDGTADDWEHYRHKVNPFDVYWGTDHSGVERPDCAIRRKLVDELVEYFETKLKELQ